MPRSRRPLPPYIRNLTPSSIKGDMYDILWDGVTYTMPLELTRSLADYFKNIYNRELSLADWYKTLPEKEKEQVFRQEEP